MEEKKILVPEQETGAESNTESEIVLNSEEEAKTFYTVVKNRLQQVSDWQHFAGAATASFQLCDAKGNDVERTVAKGDHFKIDIPGPGSATGEGYDWVRVEAIDEKKETDGESFAIRVRPATNPNNADKDIAHFFSDEATSCFMVSRQGSKVKAAVFGRNEKPNTDAERVLDKARNAAVATGAVSGFAKLQWKSLVSGLVKKDE